MKEKNLETYESTHIRIPQPKNNEELLELTVDKNSLWDSMANLVKQAKAQDKKYANGSEEKIKNIQSICISYKCLNNNVLMYEQKISKKKALDKIDFPFDPAQVSLESIRLLLKDGDNRLELIEDFEYIKYLLSKEKESKKYENEVKLSPLMNSLPLGRVGSSSNYFTIPENYDFPVISYQDVTERDMFGYDSIGQGDLSSEEKGIWGFHGFRKWEFELSKYYDAETLKNLDASDVKRSVSFFWYEIDNIQVAEPIYEENVYYSLDCSTDSRKFIVYVDTNKLGAAIHKYKVESKHPTFRGRFELHLNYSRETKTYSFPVEVCITDTAVDEKGNNKLLEGDIVSIDFGTSSTCAAIKCGKGQKLFTLSGKGKYTSSRNNPYENPTNLMIYNWPSVWNQWEKDNENCPFFVSKTKDMAELMADYDSGYTVEEEYQHADDEDGMRKVGAIISQLKMLPYYMSKGEERKLTPYNSDSNIYIVTDIEKNEENGLHFNPIAFYGYLLARAINNPAEGKLYRRYQVTYPAKFNKNLREEIRKSLEYGIKRALPLPIRFNEKRPVDVSMVYSEPEACIGAVLGSQLRQDKDETKLFAVYDLGGGTMDFAFGALRNIDEDNEDEVDAYTAMVTLTGLDGVETVGGEKLIHELAYKIYLENRTEIESKGIRFVLPSEAKYPQGFEGLLSDRGEEVSEANTNTIKELLARPLFEYSGEFNSVDDVDKALLHGAKDASEEVVDMGSGLGDDLGGSLGLDDLASDPIGVAEDTLAQNVGSDLGKVHKSATGAQTYTITLQVENKDERNIDVNLEIRPDLVKNFLKENIEKTIKQFKELMEHYFTKPENKEYLKQFYDWKRFSIKDVNIFLGGNASKQYYVENLMKDVKYFGPKQNIQRIGQGQNNEELSYRYWLNEKTAVAMGQLNFGWEYGVDKKLIGEEEPSFLFTVGYRDKNGNFIPVIEKGCVDKLWHKANRINKFSKTVDLLYSTSSTTDMDLMKHLNNEVEDFFEDGKFILYLRVNCEDKLEFRLGTSKEVPSDDEPTNEEMLLQIHE